MHGGESESRVSDIVRVGHYVRCPGLAAQDLCSLSGGYEGGGFPFWDAASNSLQCGCNHVKLSALILLIW